MAAIDYVRQTLKLEALPPEQRRREIDRFASRIRVFHYETAEEHLAPHGGGLSLKMVFRGEEHFTVGGRALRLLAGEALLMPPGVEYGSSIVRPTESFSAFFPAALCRQLAGAAFADALEPPCDAGTERLRPVAMAADAGLRGTLRLTRDCLGRADWARAEELLQRSAEQLVLTADELRAAGERLATQRASQRHELLRRLQRARAFLHDHFTEPVPLDRLAQACQLSRFHLLRCFREAFGATPAQYQAELRLQAARSLLSRRGMAVGDVARKVGYRDHSAFSRAWRRRFGTAPRMERGANAGPHG
jgi:AraC family transcriptional regulator